MKPLDLRVRCMAWPENGQWVAACVDFTLAAQGATLEQARTKLHEQIAIYVSEAVGIDAEHAEQLLTRRAPLADRMRFEFWSLVSRRPRMRRLAGQAIRAAGVAIRRKLAYIEPLPLRA